MPTVTELEQQLNRLDAEKARIKAKLSEEKRRADTKRKVLYGAAALALAEQDSALKSRLLDHLDKTVRDNDRGLVGLPPKGKS